jgi:hypothetical protein
MVSSLVYRDLQPGFRRQLFHDTHARRRRAHSVERNAAPQPLERTLVWKPRHLDSIRPRYRVPGMREPMRELAVIGEQQQPGRIQIQAADGIESRRRDRQQAENSRPALGITHRTDDATGFVEQDVRERRQPQLRTVHFHTVAADADTRTEDAYDPPVDLHSAVSNQLFRGAA